MAATHRGVGHTDVIPACAVALAWCGVVALAASVTSWVPTYIATWWWTAAFIAVTIALRRSAPLVGLVLVATIFPLAYRVGLQADAHLIPLLIATYAVVRAGRLRWWQAGAVGVAAVGALLTSGGFEPGGGWRLRPTALDFTGSYTRAAWLTVAVTAVAYLAGTVADLARARDSLREQNIELVALRADHERAAVARERLRIARDLHDVVAHHIAAIAVRAQAAEHIADATQSAAIVPWVAQTAREALTATRAVVGFLDSAGGHTPSPIETTEGKTALIDVIQRVRGAGLDVAANLPDVWPQLTPDAELALVRITQEALTNVLTHSSARAASVTIELAATTATLTITDPGPAQESVAPAPSVGGHGLSNMADRALAAGGELVQGPDGSGWSVRAHLPLTTGASR